MANTMLFGFEPYEWSNDACRGYIIMAMQDCGFSHKEIKRVLIQLYEVFDLNTLEQAKQKYLSGDYLGPDRPEARRNTKGYGWRTMYFRVSLRDGRENCQHFIENQKGGILCFHSSGKTSRLFT